MLAHFVNCNHNNAKSAAGQGLAAVVLKVPEPRIIPPLAHCCGTLLIQGCPPAEEGVKEMEGPLSVVPPATLKGGQSGGSGKGGRKREGGRERVPNPLSVSLSSSLTRMHRLGESCAFSLGRHSLSLTRGTHAQ